MLKRKDKIRNGKNDNDNNNDNTDYLYVNFNNIPSPVGIFLAKNVKGI